ncbi:hypothetical protein DPMN_068657 [Dreissena polymorpha]|uniref:Ig-like domain-containing protein n=2 Tax=Dreissena polymorpha TaxID=45954 RepID=A0A9D3Z217_DREPO|nr:hypothetical protein DPMN_068657 [Dreissena polymorpha]
MFVEKNSEFKLPCHPCNATAEDRFRSMQWVKLDYSANADGLYYIHEVVTGMDSDAKKNRVSLTLDHTLVVKNTIKADMGNYFCKPSEQNSFINRHMTWNDIQTFIGNDLDVFYFYHVDVIDLNEYDYIDVSYTSAVSPRGPKQVPALNIEVITQWQPWSACTVCDVEGTRKRIGLCTVRRYDKRYNIPDNYLHHVLSFGEDGLPCQSELLSEYSEEKLQLRPNEIQMDRCHVPCPASRRKREDLPTELPTTDYKKKVKKKKVNLGGYLILFCPGGGLRKNVVWQNGTSSTPMKIPKKSPIRVSIDILGNLHFASAEFGDKGDYSCWIGKKRKQTYVVNVVIDNFAEVFEWAKYVGISFAADLVVFIVLVALKSCTGIGRRRQVKNSADDIQNRIAKLRRGKNEKKSDNAGLQGVKANDEQLQAHKKKLQALRAKLTKK